MKTYIYTGDSPLVSMEGNDVSTISIINNHYLDIDWAWIIEEAGTFHYKNETYEVKEGDVIFVLYARYKDDDTKRSIAIMSCPAFYENYIKNKEYEKARKCENCVSCEKCCDSCSPCN